MPSVSIDYSEASHALSLSQDASGSPYVISTPFGLSILEIQGKLILPLSAPESEQDLDPEHAKTFVKVDEVRDAVKFGKLSFDERDPTKAVLFVGTSQRLNGTVETLREPLGVLRIKGQKASNTEDAKIVDIIYKKVIFKQRPLPIM